MAQPSRCPLDHGGLYTYEEFAIYFDTTVSLAYEEGPWPTKPSDSPFYFDLS